MACIPGLYCGIDRCYHYALGMADAYPSFCSHFICKGFGYHVKDHFAEYLSSSSAICGLFLFLQVPGQNQNEYPILSRTILKQLKSILTAIIIIFVVFVITSLLDVLLVFFFPRFYTQASFIVIFAVGGIFAGVMGYMNGMEGLIQKNETARWGFISLLISIGLLFFFLLAKMEGGEYEAAFKAFGATLALSSLLFVKDNPG